MDSNLLDSLPADEELVAAKNVITSFIAALKNYALYPAEHAICRKSVTNAFTSLDVFLNDRYALRLDIEKDRILFQKEVIHQGRHSEMDPAFLLFRDGIRWLKFKKGFELSSMESFFNILNYHRNPLEETEGDLVSGLWEANLENLGYKAVDIYWEGEPIIDFSQQNVKDNEDHGVKPTEDEKDELAKVALPFMNNASRELTSEEMIKLQEMIHTDQYLDWTEDILDIVLVILLNEYEKESVEAELEFLKEELKETLAQGKFKYACKLLGSLRKIHRFCETKKPWAAPLLEHFFMSISSPGFLRVLLRIKPNIDPNQLKLFRKTLLFFPPEAILALGPILLKVRSPNIEYQIKEVIKFLANKDLRPLEKLLNSSEESLTRKLVYILGQLKGQKPIEVLLKMVHHSSETVREQALTALLDHDHQVLKKLFFLIEDDNQTIRKMMLDHLGQHRSELAESLILDYLDKRQYRYKDRKHLLACYQTLGRCGSTISIPFLKKALLNIGWLPGLTRSMHRRGAAFALTGLGLKEADATLSKASRSLFPSVRRACRKALETQK